MQITCTQCGSDRFKAGQIELCPDGGFHVVMPCANCGAPLVAMHEYDPEVAGSLMEFFGQGEEAL